MRTPGRVIRVAAAALVAAVAGAPVAASPAAQDLGALVRNAPGDRVVFGFPARAGVCGAGDAILVREADGSNMFITGRMSSRDWGRWKDEEPPCRVGDVVVEAVRSGDTLREVEIRIGGPDGSEGAVLGLVEGQEAVDYLLEHASAARERDARNLILAAALADRAVRWPGLLRLAKDRSLNRNVRKSAMHWLGREAAAEAARELGGIVRDRTEDDEVREHAVFALSQLPDGQAVDLLIEVVRTVPDARIRSRALFWLADLDDPRALALFEEILTRG